MVNSFNNQIAYLGQLITEAISLFQWSRLSTVLLVVFLLVTSFDALSRKIRESLL